MVQYEWSNCHGRHASSSNSDQSALLEEGGGALYGVMMVWMVKLSWPLSSSSSDQSALLNKRGEGFRMVLWWYEGLNCHGRCCLRMVLLWHYGITFVVDAFEKDDPWRKTAMTREKRPKKHRGDAWRVGKTTWSVEKEMTRAQLCLNQ